MSHPGCALHSLCGNIVNRSDAKLILLTLTLTLTLTLIFELFQ